MEAELKENPTFIIAEIGTSHNGSLERAARLIDASAEAGADFVKTQIVFADEIIHPNTGEVELPGGRIRLYDRFRELEQDFDFYARLKEMTEAAGLEFLASPFGEKSLKWLLRLDCSFIKIASPELNHFPLLEQASASGKKIILSTGVSEFSDIEAALAVTGSEKTAILHCITAYPAPENEYNLRLIQTLSRHFSVTAGVSDHSLDPVLVPAVSAALGAGYIEKHITLKNDDGGLDDPIALTPADFSLMSRAVHRAETIEELRERFGTDRINAVLGDGTKRLAPAEAANYGRTNRSVHALKAIAEGTIITKENTALLRTEKKLKPGARPEHWNTIIGKTLLHDIKSGDGICLDDINPD